MLIIPISYLRILAQGIIFGPILTMHLLSGGIVLEVLDQLLDVLHGNRIVVAGPHTTDAAVALQTLEHALVSSSQELLLLLSISAVNAEANVHSAANALVRDNAVHLRVFVQHTVDKVGLVVGNRFLARNLLCAVCIDEVGHDLAGDPQVEDGKGVVEGVILGDGGVVKNHGAWETSDVQTVKEGCWGSCDLRGKEGFLDYDDGNTGNTDVLLSAALYPLVLKSLQ